MAATYEVATLAEHLDVTLLGRSDLAQSAPDLSACDYHSR